MNAKCALEKVGTTNDLFKQLGKFRNKTDWRGIDVNGVYLFIFENTEESVVLFNANNPGFEGSSLTVRDIITGRNIGLSIRDSISGTGFTSYHWDDPTTILDDENEEGKSPGNTPKRTYAATVKVLGEEFIIGSGFYLDPPEEEAY